MGFSSNNKGPSSAVSEINVTPLVDVMLVLLIIFMISAPLMQSGVSVELPKGNNEMEVDEDHLILSLDSEGKAYLEGQFLQPELLIEKVKAGVAAIPDRTVYIEADRRLPYGTVMEMLSELRESGVTQVSLITESVEVEK
jgi:biopolymer transport protein TolR